MVSFVTPDLAPAVPEIFLAIMACVTLLVDVYAGERYRMLAYQLAQASLFGTAALALVLWNQVPLVTFDASFVADRLAIVLKVFILLVTFFVFFYGRAYLRPRHMFRGEFFTLGLFAVLGMLVLVSAASLLTVYLGLELLSLSLYAMVALDRESLTASESAMKYFVLGALASGMLLYGMSLLYGATGTLTLAGLAPRAAAAPEGHQVMLTLGLVFVVVGIAFKIGAVPFHMWIPDVYEGAPTAVTLFVGTAPKIAAFGMLVRLLSDGLGFLEDDWSAMLAVLAVLSMAVGNLVALAQTNLKRMLAYSTIAHAGYLLLGVIAGGRDGLAAAMFYIIVYALMAAGAFGMIICLSRAGHESDRIEDFKGLNERSSWLALVMMILMLSMAGIPPFLGFWAKWFVFAEIIGAGQVWLAVIGVIFAIVGLFYYLRVVRMMYFEKPAEPGPITTAPGMRVMLGANGMAILVLGLFPTSLMALAVAALAR